MRTDQPQDEAREEPAHGTASIQPLIDDCPFNAWMGLRIVAARPDAVTLAVDWRPEFLSNGRRQSTHGGILASIVDAAGMYALATRTGARVPTVDLRIDYHRVATPGALRAEATVIARGATLATAETRIYGTDGKLVASGRCVYFVGAREGSAREGD